MGLSVPLLQKFLSPVTWMFSIASAHVGFEYTEIWAPDTMPSSEEDHREEIPPVRPTYPDARTWFSIPRPLKSLFDHFPLVTYPPNDRPFRSPSERQRPTLYIFTTTEDARLGRPSFNPTCLKWQVRPILCFIPPSRSRCRADL